MNDLQLAWAERQQQYIKDLETDLDHLRLGSEGDLQNEKLDSVEFEIKNPRVLLGYVTALYPELNALNFQSPTKHCKKVNAQKCKLLWKYDRLYWLDCQCLSMN